MQRDIDSAIEEALASGSSAREDFIGALATRLGRNAGARAVFGDPIAREHVTVVPVAKVRWGFGGGSGSGQDKEGPGRGEGAGGGGGVSATPLGFIEITDDGA